MMKIFAGIVAGLALLFLMNVNAEACTIMLVTKGASTDGSIFVAHSNDGFGSDPNVVYVPAKNHKKGSLRPVYPTAAASDELPEYNCFNLDKTRSQFAGFYDSPYHYDKKSFACLRSSDEILT